ncbi:hypothetical protein F8388_015576 [Cannabis sativa]|uniref:Uncharacterized protein n=1 Tax=Cannabis sativa TaxID=3483 RepID=A0A7J6DRX8_CANSA|nr:hypothetical protein G4B88_016269 [Cannabis sativa]KAF4348746.1 hypothetical protein F8388_015576 [Cannabis sativa]
MLWQNHPSTPSIQPLLSETSLSIVDSETSLSIVDSETSLSTTHSDHLLRNLALHNIPQNLYAKVQSKCHFVLGAKHLARARSAKSRSDSSSLAKDAFYCQTRESLEEKCANLYEENQKPEQTINELQDSTKLYPMDYVSQVITKEDLVENIENIGSSAAAVLCKISRKFRLEFSDSEEEKLIRAWMIEDMTPSILLEDNRVSSDLVKYLKNIAQSFIIKLMALLRDTILNRRLDKQESIPVNIKSYES